MSDDRIDASMESTPAIRIERLNTERTRKVSGSDTTYQVYFELSGHPQPEWGNIFEREWKGLNLTQEASVEGSFLALHCQLEEVAATQFPALKKVVAATNEAYKHYAQKEATALRGREDRWMQERKEVEALAASLRFE